MRPSSSRRFAHRRAVVAASTPLTPCPRRRPESAIWGHIGRPPIHHCGHIWGAARDGVRKRGGWFLPCTERRPLFGRVRAGEANEASLCSAEGRRARTEAGESGPAARRSACGSGRRLLEEASRRRPAFWALGCHWSLVCYLGRRPLAASLHLRVNHAPRTLSTATKLARATNVSLGHPRLRGWPCAICHGRLGQALLGLSPVERQRVPVLHRGV